MSKNKTTVVSDQNRKVREYFEKTAQDWDSIYENPNLTSVIIRERLEHFLEFADSLALPVDAKALDFGCGAGQLCYELLRREYKIVGVDVSEEMLELCKIRCSEFVVKNRAVFQKMDSEILPFPDNSFYLVAALGLIEYLQDGSLALREMHRVVQPGGYVVVTVPNYFRLSCITNPFWIVGQEIRYGITYVLGNDSARKTINGIKSKVLGIEPSVNFARKYYTPGRIEKMINDSGLKIINTLSHGFGHFMFLSRFESLSLKINDCLNRCSRLTKLRFLTKLGNNYILFCKKQNKI